MDGRNERKEAGERKKEKRGARGGKGRQQVGQKNAHEKGRHAGKKAVGAKKRQRRQKGHIHACPPAMNPISISNPQASHWHKKEILYKGRDRFDPN